MLANKVSLNKWIAAGKAKMRADAQGIDAMLKRYSDVLIREKELKNFSIDLGHKKVEGFIFNLYQPCYKSSPVGMIHDIAVCIDGKTIKRDDIQLILKGGQRIMLYDARTIQDLWWNITDPIIVFAHKKGGLTAGKHDLEIIVAEQIGEYYEHPLNMIMGTTKVSMKLVK